MIYKIITGKNEIRIDEEDKLKFEQNIDKNFIRLKSGELVNPSFVQGIVIDHESGRNEKLTIENRKVVMIDGKPTIVS
jgi:hypothetical protein